MISVLLYGRNDAHGYNLHRRAALSLNCLAEVLTDPADEILFVDYNTPDELPTLIEALADTLTARCLARLRVIRVPAALHEQRFAARTHLPALEPVARNAAARRANPANRWLLSTNTDMILLPSADRSLSEICRELPDGFYGLPRFELPEWLWERLPRSDPAHVMAELRLLGAGLRLDEPTVSHEWIRFDAPGDFQLMLRDDLLAINGFDEEMLLGWHVDSNLSRRMLILRGSIGTLEADVAGYHCNHSRIPTVYHGSEWIANDLGRFFLSVEQPELPGQRDTWGLADTVLEATPGDHLVGRNVARSVLAAVGERRAPLAAVDAQDVKFALSYDSGHVLPFVADSLAVSPSRTTVGYIGANPVLEQMLAELVQTLELGGPVVADLDDMSSVEELDRTVDVVVVDLGLDSTYVDDDGNAPAGLRPRLQLVLDALHRLVERERARLERGEHPRRFVLVNSGAAYWNAFVLAQLHCSHTTAHSRVRRATVKQVADADAETLAAHRRALRLFRWADRLQSDTPLALRPGEVVEVAELDDFRGFGEGWAYPDKAAVWTQGPRAKLKLDVHALANEAARLELTFDKVGVADASCSVELLLNGVHAGTRQFVKGASSLTWAVMLPRPALGAGTVDAALVFPDAVAWADDRKLGLHLKKLALRRVGWRKSLDAARGILRPRGTDAR